MTQLPRVQAAGRGTASRMNPISTLTGIAHDVLKAPFTLAGSALRLGRSVIGKAQHTAQHEPSPPEPEVEITPDRPVNVTEELGLEVPPGEPQPLGEIKQPSGKLVTVFALGADLDVSETTSNTFELEWPKGSGRLREFPEVDRAEWFELDEARRRLTKGQAGFVDLLVEVLATG